MRETDSFRELRDQLLRLAGSEPDETTSYDGMVDFHWGFIDLADAEHLPPLSVRWCPSPTSFFCDSPITITWMHRLPIRTREPLDIRSLQLNYGFLVSGQFCPGQCRLLHL